MQTIMPNATIMITVSKLHKMHLTLRNDGHWVRACIAPISPIPPTVREGSTTQTTLGASSDMIVA